MQIVIDTGANNIIKRLQSEGYKAYAVGGCVRDSFLGLEPHDWDICTNALPDDVINIFGRKRCLLTGIKNGTVSVKECGVYYEVTTFRVDGEYTDSRHPNSVKFVTDVKEDLARRDFTINAMAYNDTEGLIDPFNGYDDLLINRVVRSVGNARDRFTEDALRIMRLFRFAAKYGLDIENDTLTAARELCDNIKNISKERVQGELFKMLLTNNPVKYIVSETNVMSTVLPELYKGQMKNTLSDIAKRVPLSEQIIELRLAVLLQDVALSSNVISNIGSNKDTVGANIAESILMRLKCPKSLIRSVGTLVRYHCFVPSIQESERRIQALHLLNSIGKDELFLLIKLCRANFLASGTTDDTLCLTFLNHFEKTVNVLLQENACYNLKGLNISGEDLLNLNNDIDGVIIGKVLNKLLDMALNEEIKNDNAVLIEKTKDILKDDFEIFV